MDAELLIFARVISRPEAELDLVRAALLVAEAEYPGLDVAHYAERLAALGDQARADVRGDAPVEERIRAALELLYGRLGFKGNQEDYYDPRNSFLNEVIDRRTGIPITLAIVLVAVLERAGVTARGVSFPGHFLVRVDGPRGAIFIDPFAGRPIDRNGLRALHARATGHDKDPTREMLEPASKAQILTRLLNNLRTIYSNKSDHARLRGVLARLQLVAPTEAERRAIEQQIDQLGDAGLPRGRGPLN